MYIKRKIEDDILRYLDRPEILAIVGPRQCGKTTTLRKIYAGLTNAVFLTFEDQDILSLFENDIKQFADTYLTGKKYALIDEFQYAKNGGKLLKYLYDTRQTKIIISGSSAIDLTIKAIKFLVGRVFVINMNQFDFYEYLLSQDKNFAGIYEKNKINLMPAGEPKKKNQLAPEQLAALEKHYQNYAIWGGYPRVALAAATEEKKEILKNIYNTYFLRDVRNTLGLIDDFKLAKLIKALSLQAGGMIEYNELSRISEFSAPTLKKYLNFLAKTYICDFIAPFYKNKRKEIVKNKKIYFFDAGLRNAVINDFRGLDSRPDAGSLIENAFWMQAVKKQHPCQFWRNKNKNEIDFIIDLGENKIAAVEIKQSRDKCQKLPAAFTKEYKQAVPYCFYLKSRGQNHDEMKKFLPLF